MSKQSHEHGYAFEQAKRFGDQARIYIVSGRVRQQLTYGVTLFITITLLFATGFFAKAGDAWARPMFAAAPPLGTALSFAVLAGSTATNTGSTVITGDLGVSPGDAVIGFPPGTVTGGTIHAADATAAQAQADTTAAYNNLAGQACNSNLTSQNLGGLTLTPGVYCFSTSAQLTGILTLDGQGDPNAVFIFQIGSTLTTASDSSVLLINSASSCNVFWQIGSSATLGTSTAFAGSMLALTSITLNTSASLLGGALAQNGAVTMDSNTITMLCTLATPTSTATATGTLVADTPTPTDTATGTPSTSTPTPTATAIGTPSTSTPTPTATATGTPSTSTPTPTATATGTPSTSTPTPTATLSMTAPATPTSESALEPPTALKPIDEPSASTVTLYLPFLIR